MLAFSVQQAPGDERAKRARHEEAESSSTGPPPDRQLCPHEIVPDEWDFPPQDRPPQKGYWMRHRSTGQMWLFTGIGVVPSAHISSYSLEDVADVYPFDGLPALRDSAVLCKVLSAASSGTMNHFAATREEQVEALQLLQMHRKAESVQEARDLVRDSVCFASL